MKNILLFVTIVLVFGVSLSFAQKTTILAAATSLNLTTFVQISSVTAVDLVATTGISVFAPTNAAFSSFATSHPAIYAALIGNTTLLRAALLYHIANGTFNSSQFTNNGLLPTLQGSKIRTNVYSSFAGLPFPTSTVNGIVISSVTVCTNGLLYTITDVLIAPTTTVLQAINATGTFNTLISGVGLASLTPFFNGANSLTLFAPTDTAFAALPSAYFQALSNPANSDILRTVLQYHVVQGVYYPLFYSNSANNLTTLLENQISFVGGSSQVGFVGTNAFFSLASPIYGIDGVAFALNATLFPPINLQVATRLSNLNILLSIFAPLDYDGALAFPSILNLPGVTVLTLFGPTDAAFNALTPSQNATVQNDPNAAGYFLVNGSFPFSSWTNDQLVSTISNGASIRLNIYNTPNGVIHTANGAPILSYGNFQATSGVLQVVNQVLFPPTSTLNLTISGDSRFTILRTVIQKTNALAALASLHQPVTIFAPIDTAFNQLPNLASLLNDTNALFGVLLNHVVISTYFSAGLYDGQQLKTAAATTLPVAVNSTTVTVGGATVIQANVYLLDALVHVVDKVIILPAATTAATGATGTNASGTNASGTNASGTNASGTNASTAGSNSTSTETPATTTAHSDASSLACTLFTIFIALNFAL
jgi:transforming growth factor-beta-induced protein